MVVVVVCGGGGIIKIIIRDDYNKLKLASKQSMCYEDIVCLSNTHYLLHFQKGYG